MAEGLARLYWAYIRLPIGAPSVSKPAVKAVGVHVGVDDRGLNVAMSEIVLDAARIASI